MPVERGFPRNGAREHGQSLGVIAMTEAVLNSALQALGVQQLP